MFPLAPDSGYPKPRGLRRSVSDQEAQLARVDVELRELLEHHRDHRVLVRRRLGVEEVRVVDEAATEVVEHLEELELVVADADELHEDRQLAHQRQQLDDVLVTILRLAVGDEDGVGRVRRGGLDGELAVRRRVLALEEASTTTA